MDDPSDELPFVDILQEVRNMTPYEKQRCLEEFICPNSIKNIFDNTELEEGD